MVILTQGEERIDEIEERKGLHGEEEIGDSQEPFRIIL